jgi:hypothetical protein
MPVSVVATATRAHVEESAGQPCEINVASIVIFDLDQAALSTAVAEGFPLGGRHLFQRLSLPERRGVLGQRLLGIARFFLLLIGDLHKLSDCSFGTWPSWAGLPSLLFYTAAPRAPRRRFS